VQHLLVVITQERKFETIFCWIERDSPRSSRAIKAVHSFPFNASQINWIVECADNTVVAGP
jgi:hypothetical protein